MGRPGGALNSHVGLQEEIPIARFGSTADWIRRPSINLLDAVPSIVHGRRIKARIVTFPYDDECDAWQAFSLQRRVIDVLANRAELFIDFQREYSLLLALGDAVTVDENVLW